MKKNVSIVIPTYNGFHLLEKNLKEVIDSARNNDEILIADDNSTDETKEYLLAEFGLKKAKSNLDYNFYQNKVNLKGKNIFFSFLQNKKNLRFGANCNLAIKLAKSSFIFLLNNDVVPKTNNIIEILLKKFENKKDVFAVSCLEYESHKKINSGKNKIWFEKGRFFHSRDEDLVSGKTAWASGGSCLLDKEKFLQIGGFNKLFYPAYWEDIDLSWQARKRGWQVLFEKKALVHHNHETTNQSVFGNKKIEEMSWKNGSKFVLKNGNFWQKISFLFHLPYWSYKKNRLGFFIFLFFLIGIFFRFFQFSNLPVGFYEDEAAIGYNGFAIWQQRRDEWLVKLPVSFQSFGDYKAPLAIYLNGFFTFIFGLNIWAVRLPSLIYSLVAIFFFVQLIKQIFLYLDYPKLQTSNLSWLAGLILLFNPAHFLFSQIAFEVSLVFLLIVLAFFYFFKFLNYDKKINLFLSSLCFSLSLYTYHSSKIFVPLILISLLIIFRKELFKKKNLLFLGSTFLFNALILFPLIKDSFFGQGLTRANVSFILQNKYSFTQKILIFCKNLIHFFNPKFLLMGDNLNNWRHGTNFLGIIYPTTFFLFLWGLAVNIKTIFKKTIFKRDKQISYFLILGLYYSILPSLITINSPHILRSFLSLFFLIIFSILGFFNLFFYLKNEKFKKLIIYGFLFFQLLFFSLFYCHYLFVYPKQSSFAFQEGYEDVFSEANLYLEGKNRKKVNSIFLTNKYGHPEIFAIFFNKIKPIDYHHGFLYQYQFLPEFNIGDLDRKKSLIITDGESELPEDLAEKIIYGADGSIRFKIYLTNDLRN